MSRNSYLLFWLEILTEKSILQTTVNEFGQAASKYGRNRDTRAVFSASHFADEFAYVLLCCAIYFSFSFAFHRRNLIIFPRNLAWNSFYTVESPNFLSLPVKFNSHANRTAVFVCLFFLNPVAEIMLNMLFNTLLKIKSHNRQKKKKKKRKNTIRTSTTIFAVDQTSSS